MLPPYLEKDMSKADAHLLDHGWDETKPLSSLTDDEIQAAAKFRGGRFVGRESNMCVWECEHGHRFEASLEYVLLGGGWCPQCSLENWKAESTPKNKFLSQLKG